MNPKKMATPPSTPCDSHGECVFVGSIKPKVVVIEDDPVVADALAMVPQRWRLQSHSDTVMNAP